MKRSNAVFGLIIATGLAGTAQAVTLESGVVFGGPSQTHVACVLVNLGTTTVTLTSKQLVGQFSGVMKPTFDDCGRSLLPKQTCSFQVPTPTNESASCKVVVGQTTAEVRGTMMSLTDPLDKPLSESDLR
jgi:hypothetical protein